MHENSAGTVVGSYQQNHADSPANGITGLAIKADNKRIRLLYK